MLTKALNILRKRSIPRISAMPATGMVGITESVATSAMKDAPCTPLAPLEVSTATARMVSCWIKVRWVLVACATNRAAMVMYRLVPSVLKVNPVGTTNPTRDLEQPSLSSLAIRFGIAISDELRSEERRVGEELR